MIIDVAKPTIRSLLAKLCRLLGRKRIPYQEKQAALTDLEHLQKLIAAGTTNPADLTALTDEGRQLALTGFVLLITNGLDETPAPDPWKGICNNPPPMYPPQTPP